jgi:hypothetical protein
MEGLRATTGLARVLSSVQRPCPGGDAIVRKAAAKGVGEFSSRKFCVLVAGARFRLCILNSEAEGGGVHRAVVLLLFRPSSKSRSMSNKSKNGAARLREPFLSITTASTNALHRRQRLAAVTPRAADSGRILRKVKHSRHLGAWRLSSRRGQPRGRGPASSQSACASDTINRGI